jgi:hypothetical protein
MRITSEISALQLPPPPLPSLAVRFPRLILKGSGHRLMYGHRTLPLSLPSPHILQSIYHVLDNRLLFERFSPSFSAAAVLYVSRVHHVRIIFSLLPYVEWLAGRPP